MLSQQKTFLSNNIIDVVQIRCSEYDMYMYVFFAALHLDDHSAK